jgi:hypothetical protein
VCNFSFNTFYFSLTMLKAPKWQKRGAKQARTNTKMGGRSHPSGRGKEVRKAVNKNIRQV